MLNGPVNVCLFAIYLIQKDLVGYDPLRVVRAKTLMHDLRRGGFFYIQSNKGLDSGEIPGSSPNINIIYHLLSILCQSG